MFSHKAMGWYFLLFTLSSYYILVKGEKVIPPMKFVKIIDVNAPYLEPYSERQMALENIANNSNLYGVALEERQVVLNKLLQDPKVQEIISECKKFHVQLECKNSLYRSADGTCNNLKHPKWGSTNTEKDRLLPPVYEGPSGYRKSIKGQDLPCPRCISQQLKQEENLSHRTSVLFTFFGQLIAHEITLAPVSTVNGSLPTCSEPSTRNRPLCMTFNYPEDDVFFSPLNITRENFIRGIPYPKCNFDKRGPINIVTAFIDGSVTYGSDIERAMSLREKDGFGRLKIQDSIFGTQLPKDDDEMAVFCVTNRTENCLRAGDIRANQNTMLMILQTIFLRYHNLIADYLHELNSYWSDEKIYQETRRIVGAVLQYIVYKEYLHLLVGQDNMDKYDLNVDFDKRSYYDDTIRPIVITEFSTGAFRLHSMIPRSISSYSSLKMRTSFSLSSPLFHGKTNDLLTGASEIASEKCDRYVNEDVSNFLYRFPPATYGFDLAAVNVNRGRDHGLAPYIMVARMSSEAKTNIQSFENLSQTMTKENIELLRKIYDDVADIDLWVGLLMETPLEDAEVGPTVSCIISQQFHRLKFGDRFFFTHVNGRYPFSKEQLDSIKSFSLAKVICLTTSIPFIRQLPLQMPNKNNPLISCSTFHSMNLMPWKENPGIRSNINIE